jgi:hypothetical protein
MDNIFFDFNSKLCFDHSDSKGVDETASPHQSVLWHIGECGQNANMDRNFNLRARRHYQKASEDRGEPLHDITDFERFAFRKKPDFTGAYGP